MARFNTALTSASISGTATIGSPSAGAFTNLTGTAPYTVTVPDPRLHPGVNQVFYNATSGTVTLTTPSGNFNGTGGNGTGSTSVFAGNVVSITSDGAHYVVISEDGSALTATTGAFSGNVTMNGSGATVNITPSTLTVAPTGASTIDSVAIGSTTRAAGAFTSLAANAAVTFTANTASSSTGTGTLVVTGGIGASGQVTATAVSATNLTGTLQTAAQPNITSTGGLTAPQLILNPGTGIAVVRRSTVNGSNGVRVQGNAADGYPTDTDAGAYIQLGGGVIGDTYEGNVDIVAYGGNVDANRNQIRFSNRSAANTVTERMRIDSSGNVGIGVTPSAGQALVVGKDITGAVGSAGATVNGTIQSGVTSVAWGVRTNLSTVASAFTLANLRHHDATQGTFGAGSTVTNQSGFFVDNSLIGATNNYGFFGNIPSAANRWNLYMNGTADNYMNGNLGIGTNAPGVKLEVAGAAKLTGTNLSIVPSTTTNSAYLVNTNASGNFFFGIDNSTGSSFGVGNYARTIYSSAAYPLVFLTNSTERMRINQSGTVGIGTNNPLTKLQVTNGNIVADSSQRGSEIVSSGASSTTGETNALGGWAQGYTGLTVSSVGTTGGVTPQSGSFMIALTSTNANNGARADYSFFVSAGKRYQISYYTASGSGNTANTAYDVYVASSGSLNVDNYGTWVVDDPSRGVSQGVSQTTAWVQTFWSVSAAKTGVYYLSFRVAGNQTGNTQTFIDSLSIQEIQGSGSAGGQIAAYNAFVGNVLYANNVTATSISATTLNGTSYAATSTTSSMAIVDTAITNYGNGAVYQVHACGCPNVNGSGAYLDQVYGKVVIGTGYSGTAVTSYIYFVQENMPRPYDSGGTELTIDAVFWDGTTETTSQGAGGSRQIRVKVGFPSAQGVGGFNCLISRVI